MGDRGFFLIYGDAVSCLRNELTSLLGPDMARSVMFRFGYKCGSRSARELGLNGQGDQALEYLREIWAEMGLARLESVRRDGSGIVVILTDTLESSHSEDGCDFTRGFLGGVMAGITGVAHHCAEEQCVSGGSEQCMFRAMEAKGGGGA